MSPTPGRSILITSAPNQARSCVQVGPDCTCVKSRMRTPSSALPAPPHGALDGAGKAWPFPFAFFAADFLGAGFFAAAFTTFFVVFLAALFFAATFFTTDFFAVAFFAVDFAFFAFFFVAMSASLFLLLQRALRIEIANASAFAAGGRIKNRIDERRLAAVHGGVHRPLEFVRRG